MIGRVDDFVSSTGKSEYDCFLPCCLVETCRVSPAFADDVATAFIGVIGNGGVLPGDLNGGLDIALIPTFSFPTRLV